MRRLLRSMRREDGAVAVLFAMLLPVLFGVGALTVDVTRSFVERRELQNVADAAALAAASYLPSDDPAVLAQATDTAIEYAARNGLTIGPDAVVFFTVSVQYDAVTVSAQRGVVFALASILGASDGTVHSGGTAQVGDLSGLAGVLPWGLQQPEGGFVFGQQYCLKLGSSGDCSGAYQGNFGAIDVDDLGNGSADEYRDRIVSGSGTVVRVGQIKSAVNGNMTGPTSQGLGCSGNNGRLTGNTQTFDQVIRTDADGGYTVLDWRSPRLGIIPVVQWLDDEAEIRGFAIFFIEDCAGNGAVTGRFIDTVVPGGQWGALSGTGFGGRAMRLVG